MARRVDPKAKARKQRIIAAVAAVLLLAVLAIQVPRTMKMLNQSSAAPAPAPEAPAPAPGADPAGTPAPPPARPAVLVDTDPVPAPQRGQLVSFGLFKSKDPFEQQVEDTPPVEEGLDPTAGLSPTDPLAPGTGLPTDPGAPAIPVTPTTPTMPTTPSAPTTPAAQPGTSAAVTVNGVSETVAVGATFPQADPLFRLVSLTTRSAEIGIAGGAYQSGAKTVTLAVGKRLTLMNTIDGSRYVLQLVSVATG